MSRIQNTLGLIGGVLLILSAGAHSLLGWTALSQKLAAAKVPADLVQGLKIGWHFGGIAMVAMGVITAVLFWMRLRRRDAPTFPAGTVAIAYLAFASWAILDSGFDPFFLVFLIPGTLLGLGAFQPRSARL